MLLDDIQDLRILDQALAQGLEKIIHHHRGGLPLGDSAARRVHFVLGQMLLIAGCGR